MKERRTRRAAERPVIGGTVRNGVIIPDSSEALPEGARVQILLPSAPSPLPPELKSELDAWERASDEAWAMIDRWERESGE